MRANIPAAIAVLMLLSGCATVRPQDLAAWEGQPVGLLDRHPVFLSMRLVKSRSADGMEIRNYVNGAAAMSCAKTTCTTNFEGCNNIFYIKDGRVVRYTPVGIGGMRCFTDDTLAPNFSGPTNL